MMTFRWVQGGDRFVTVIVEPIDGADAGLLLHYASQIRRDSPHIRSSADKQNEGGR
jgi:hypothetical protein